MAAIDSQVDCAEMTAFQRDLLVVLADNEPCKGVTIMHAIKDRYPTVTAGRLYPNLDVLVGMALVTKREKNGRTNEYSLSQRGEKLLNDHRQWIADSLDSEKELATDGGVDLSEQNPRGHRLTQEWHKGSHMITCLNCHAMHVSRKDFERYDCDDPGAFERQRRRRRNLKGQKTTAEENAIKLRKELAERGVDGR